MVSLVAATVLAVAIHNGVSVPDDILASAKANVARMFAAAHIDISWVSAVDARPFGVQVVLRRQPGGGLGAIAPSALAVTIGEGHSHGSSCFVFYERVLKFAYQHHVPVELVLAYAIAHEFGHVLLPAPAHASSGLMKAEWSDDDVRHFAIGARLFTPDQVALMNKAIVGDHASTSE